jgi:hypothetical protein
MSRSWKDSSHEAMASAVQCSEPAAGFDALKSTVRRVRSTLPSRTCMRGRVAARSLLCFDEMMHATHGLGHDDDERSQHFWLHHGRSRIDGKLPATATATTTAGAEGDGAQQETNRVETTLNDEERFEGARVLREIHRQWDGDKRRLRLR